jgi:glyoxylase-like metal-dependent hydrolase (beta-lactamase superfamily II)
MSGRWDPELPAATLAASAGIHCIPIPTPFLIGPVNLYLIEDDPLTLVDTGPNSGLALEAVGEGLCALGRKIEEIERIVLTHQHMDHIGLAGVLARTSGAEVAAISGLGPCLEDYAQWMACEDAFAERVMARHGIPDEVRLALQAVSASFRAWGAPVTPDIELVDGGTVGFAGRELEVHARPGHSPSDTIFLDRRSGVLIGGDHLLAGVSSNPLIARRLAWGLPGDPASEALERPHQLEIYLESLAGTEAMDGIEAVLGGHGPAFSDYRTLVAERRGLHERRASKILKMLGDGPATAHELAERMWGNVAVTQAYLTLSEILGHVDLLRASGSVQLEEDGGVVRFAAS